METSSAHRPKTEEISRYAYLLYEQRGRQPGHEMEDWLKAEKHLSTEAANGSAPISNNSIVKAQTQAVRAPEAPAAKRSRQR